MESGASLACGCGSCRGEPGARRSCGRTRRGRMDGTGSMGYATAPHRALPGQSTAEESVNSTYRVAVLVGSLRQGSITRRVADALSEVAPAELTLEQVEMGDLPLYNQDFDDQHRVPADWTEFRRRIAAADAVLFV